MVYLVNISTNDFLSSVLAEHLARCSQWHVEVPQMARSARRKPRSLACSPWGALFLACCSLLSGSSKPCSHSVWRWWVESVARKIFTVPYSVTHSITLCVRLLLPRSLEDIISSNSCFRQEQAEKKLTQPPPIRFWAGYSHHEQQLDLHQQ